MEAEQQKEDMEAEKDKKVERRVETEIVDRMEQWATGYGIHMDQLVQTMPFILEEAASDWWNTTPTRINSWAELTTELLEYFLPPRYEEQVEMQITQLRQRESEPVREYAMSLRKLMRFTKLSEDQKLDRIYRSCRSKIKLCTRRAGFETLTQFLKLAEEVEEIEASEGQTGVEQPRQQRVQAEICMRCGETGHAARTCNNPPRLFCWVCGRNGVKTTECCDLTLLGWFKDS
ncbi:uncharacterized protein LOC122625004 [Drosophila teissieri]|uniref:uncharacterized protein LOC122625004 n=1 Tax=Drosophila teissieri TaxID=7243 RepID=UPI001CBA35BE|nr:uncharacterized protein LOC122625004 [Drosophila teissieri]